MHYSENIAAQVFIASELIELFLDIEPVDHQFLIVANRQIRGRIRSFFHVDASTTPIVQTAFVRLNRGVSILFSLNNFKLNHFALKKI